MEKQLQSKITELRDKEIVTIELQRLCSKMEKQLVQQVIKHPFLVFLFNALKWQPVKKCENPNMSSSVPDKRGLSSQKPDKAGFLT